MHVAAMPDLDDLDHDFAVVHGVHNPIIPDAQSVGSFATSKLRALRWSRLTRKTLDDFNNLASYRRGVDRLKLFCG